MGIHMEKKEKRRKTAVIEKELDRPNEMIESQSILYSMRFFLCVMVQSTWDNGRLQTFINDFQCLVITHCSALSFLFFLLLRIIVCFALDRDRLNIYFSPTHLGQWKSHLFGYNESKRSLPFIRKNRHFYPILASHQQTTMNNVGKIGHIYFFLSGSKISITFIK